MARLVSLAIAAEFSKYETYEAYSLGWHPNIDSASRFSSLLQGIYEQEPDLIASAVAKGTHDKLNAAPGGIEVENAKGDQWQLSGDAHLNEATRAVARKAVAQSQLDIISVFNASQQPDYPALFKNVWDYTPQPTANGLSSMKGMIQQSINVAGPDLRASIVNLVRDNYLLLINELVKRKKLRPA